MRGVAWWTFSVLLLSGCSSQSAEDRATAVYEACIHGPLGAEMGHHIRLDGRAIRVEVTGTEAAAVAAGEALISSGGGDEPYRGSDMETSVRVNLSVHVSMDCLLKQTNYPGAIHQLRDGDSWAEWRYEEAETVGSEVRYAFVATR